MKILMEEEGFGRGEEKEEEEKIKNAGMRRWRERNRFRMSLEILTLLMMSVSSNNACAVDDNGIACWGDLVGMSAYRKRPPSTKALKVFLSVALGGA